MMFGLRLPILPLAQAGKIRALAVTSAKRSSFAPELPTMAETLPGFEVVGWYGLAAPAGTPAEVVGRLNAEANRALQSPDLNAQVRKLGYEEIGGTPEEAQRPHQYRRRALDENHSRCRHRTAVADKWIKTSKPTLRR